MRFSPAWFTVDAFFVLAKEFKKYLEELNIKAPIYLTTTKVNDHLIRGVDTKKIEKIKTILFLARVEREKGIFTTIDAFDILSQKYSWLQLRVVGRGNILNEAREYAKNANIANIFFTGPLSGEALISEFINADIYILPTTHGEGMPTSVLEAMAFGIPVISRPVGGLVDFFENDNMGYLVDSVKPEDFAEKIEILIRNIKKVNQISAYNARYAKEHFFASKVAKQVEEILSSI